MISSADGVLTPATVSRRFTRDGTIPDGALKRRMGKADWVKGDLGRLGTGDIRSNRFGEKASGRRHKSICMLDSLDASSLGALPANITPIASPPIIIDY